MAAAYSSSSLNTDMLLILLLLASHATRKSHGSSEMEKFDQFMKKLMPNGKVPGARLALAKDGHLQYFKVFGVADRQNGDLLTTHHTMRYNSISKVFTGVAILKLVQEGRLNLHDKPFGFLDNLPPPRGATVDPRLFNITIQHILQHTGGWKGTLSERNVFLLPAALYASHSLGRHAPPTVYDAMLYMKSVPLDFDPGSAMQYSNFGYAVLGRVIKKVSGMNYAEYMQRHLFIPLSLTGMKLPESPVGSH